MRELEALSTWVINLDRAPERLARIHRQLDGLGLPYTRLPAADARQRQPGQLAQLVEAACRQRHGMSPVLGKLGCYLSHVAVMQALLASPARFALVLEDDMLLQPELPAVMLMSRCTGSSAHLVNRGAAEAHLTDCATTRSAWPVHWASCCGSAKRADWQPRGSTAARRLSRRATPAEAC